MKMQFEHISVLAAEVVDFAPQSTQTILDCTLGGGGHSKRLLEKFPEANLYGIDRDAKALNAAADCLKNYKEQIPLSKHLFQNYPNVLKIGGNLDLIIFWLISAFLLNSLHVRNAVFLLCMMVR